jgi:uncharacterized protein YjbJ (UPF0337 family)
MSSAGILDKVIGRVKEAAGSLLDDDDLRREGRTDQTAGRAKQKSDEVIDAAREKSEEIVDTAKEKLSGDDRPRDGA